MCGDNIMMELINDIYIRCNRCNDVIKLYKDEIDFTECVNRNSDDDMGEEIEFHHHSYIRCRNCGNKITLDILGREYPAGAFDYEDSDISGGVYEEKPHMCIVYSQEDFDLQNSYPRFTAVEQMIMQIAQDPKLVYEITPRDFEKVVEKLLQDQGFETKLTPQTRDGGRDIIATKYEIDKPIVFYIECKRYQEQNSVDVSIVRSLLGVQTADRVNKTILFTTGHVTRDAKQFVDDQNTLISILDVDEIHKLIRRSAEKLY